MKLLKHDSRLLIILSIIIVSTLSLYIWYIKNIKGPFIFLDETVYFNLARSIHESFTFSGEQYNPLYPFLISVAFFGNNEVEAYEIIKFFNILVFSSMVIPLYLICKRIYSHFFLQIFIPSIIIFLPWKSVVNIIWAEPLYYTLFIWSCFLYIFYIEKKSYLRAVFLGLSLGFLFLTKQSGLILFTGVIFALGYEFLIIEKKKLININKHLIVISVGIMTFFPWLIRNMIYEKTAFGYSSEINLIKNNLFNFLDVANAFLYQISYISIATHFIFFIIFITLIINLRHYDKEKQSFIILILFYTIGIILLSAYHRINNPEIPFGRYTTVVIPFMIIIIIHYIINSACDDKRNIQILLLGFLIYIITLKWSVVINSLYSYSYLNNFDLAIWNDFFVGNGIINWKPDKTIKGVTLLSSLFLLITIGILLPNNKRLKFYGLICLLLFMVYSGFRSNYYVYSLSKSTTDINDMFRFIINENIPQDQLYRNVELNYLDKTWLNYELKPISFSDFNKRILLDFGRADSPVADDAYDVQAPWIGKSLYNSKFNYFGFDHNNLDNIDSRVSSESESIKGLEDCIFGWKDAKFYVELAKGNYNITFYNNPNLIESDVSYDLIINGKYLGSYSKRDEIISLEFYNNNDLLTIELLPHKDRIWSISLIEIVNHSIENRVDGFYVITSKELPYSCLYENNTLKLYSLPIE